MDEEEKKKEELKDKMVEHVASFSALINEYVRLTGLDAYECTMMFISAGGELRIKVTDNKYKMGADGQLKKLPSDNPGPNASSFDEAEERRQAKAKGVMPPEPQRPAKTPEQVVADLMKKLRLK